MVNEIKETMTVAEMERAIDILLCHSDLEDLELETFDSIVVNKLVTVIHRSLVLK